MLITESLISRCWRGLQLDTGMNFGQAQKENAIFFVSAKRENVHAASRLDLNPNILQVQGCSIQELFLQLISYEREK